MADLVYFECIEENKKVRVRIISNGYNKNANCQFPRDVRIVGRKFMAPASAVKVASGRAGTFFYRINKKDIKAVQDETPLNLTIYESEDCCICLDQQSEIVMVDCGHLCMCQGCSE